MMKHHKPTTQTQRHTVTEDFSLLTKKRPERALTFFRKKNSGHNSAGRISTRHKGGGHKQLYRFVEYGQKEMLGQTGKVIALEYDPNRTAFINLVDFGGKKFYVIAPQGLNVGDAITFAEKAEIKVGNRMKLKNIPVGTSVFNVEIQPDQGGKLIKAAGSSAIVLANENGVTNLKMPSSEVRTINDECYATVGAISRPEHKYVKLGKAGRSRWKGIRPTVRGTVMNPVDHPHGGGEGRQPLGMSAPKTPWGKIARGVKTRKRKYTNKYILARRTK